MTEDTSELTTFVKNTLESIKQGIGEIGDLETAVTFDLAVVRIKEAGGKLRLFVVEAGGKYQKEEISRVKFGVRVRSEGPSHAFLPA